MSVKPLKRLSLSKNPPATHHASCTHIVEFDYMVWWQEKLESDIKVKKNSLLIDQQKCMSMRRTLPYNIVATRYF